MWFSDTPEVNFAVSRLFDVGFECGSRSSSSHHITSHHITSHTHTHTHAHTHTHTHQTQRCAFLSPQQRTPHTGLAGYQRVPPHRERGARAHVLVSRARWFFLLSLFLFSEL